MRKRGFALESIFMLVTLFAMASRFLVPLTVAQVGEDGAISALADADGALVSAYRAVIEAEEAGANVSDLLVRLNESGLLLTRARMAYWAGDFDETVSLAASSRTIGVEVQDEAVLLKSAAQVERVQLIILTVAMSGVSIGLVASGGFWIWRTLGKRHGQSAALSKRIGDEFSDER